MRLDKFTIKAQEAVQEAQRSAEEMSHQQIEMEHLLKALLSQENGIVKPVVERIGARPEMLLSAVDAELTKRPKIYGEAQPGAYVSPDLKKVLDSAEKEAEDLKDEFVSTEHILLAMVASKGTAGELLRAFGISKVSILSVLKDLRGGHRCSSLVAWEKSKLEVPETLFAKDEPGILSETLCTRVARPVASEPSSSTRLLNAESIVREESGGKRAQTIEFGFRGVRSPGRKEELCLVVLRGFGAQPLILLTNLQVKPTRTSLFFVVEASVRRWQTEGLFGSESRLTQ